MEFEIFLLKITILLLSLLQEIIYSFGKNIQNINFFRKMIPKSESLFSTNTYIAIIIIILKIIDFSGEIFKKSIFRENIANIDVFISIHQCRPFSMSMFRNIEVFLSMSYQSGS